jgi:L-iditol 2-dehydrogenase
MKAMMLTGIRSMAMRQVPDPEIRRPTDVLVRVCRVGVCGSDIHYYTQGRIGAQVVQFPFIVGHECAGTVAAVGSAVTQVKPGDRIFIEPASSCGECDQCRAGRTNTCRRVGFLGAPGQGSGALAELVVVPEESCLPIRDTTSLERAALAEPFSIAVYAVRLYGKPIAGATIGILGSGPIGLSVLAAARAGGAERAYVTDRIDGRLLVARDAGAGWTGNPDTTDVVAEIAALEPLGLDVVFECCGQQQAIDQAVELLKPGGVLVLVGVPEVDRISLDIDLARRKEIVLQNVRRQNGAGHEALELLESGKAPLDFLITHRLPLERCAEAFDLVAGYKDGVLKAMIEVGGA